jgi:choline dehydrogenase-like flavoprotein
MRAAVEGGSSSRWDAVVVGSGFGGSMAALRLVSAGARVLLLERGDRVARGEAASRPDATLELTPYFDSATPYRCLAGGYGDTTGSCACVGGASLFYGGAAMRLRVRDFENARAGGGWPYRYADLEPYYCEAERLLGVAGDDAGDPTAPPRSAPYPHAPAPLAPVSRRLLAAARDLGLSPFRLPLAINHGGDASRPRCTACRTCDTYACAIEAKNDLEVAVLRPLEGKGLTIWPRTVATRLEREGRRVRRLVAYARDAGRSVAVEARLFVLAGGALATPHLLLASRLAERSTAPEAVGRYLFRHANAKVSGVFASEPDPDRLFHKQLAIHDWYFGEDGEKMGCVQQVTTPPRRLIEKYLPPGLGAAVGSAVEHLAGLLCIAEDVPQRANGVTLDPRRSDAFGLPQLVIEHRYTAADRRRLGALVSRSKRVLRRMGALFCHAHLLRTFSHALGTVRMGEDPRSAPLDAECRFRGLENLWVTDGSALPSSGAVNPSLTIAANALRAAEAMTRA